MTATLTAAGLLDLARSVAVAVVPLAGLFLVFQVLFLRLPGREADPGSGTLPGRTATIGSVARGLNPLYSDAATLPASVAVSSLLGTVLGTVGGLQLSNWREILKFLSSFDTVRWPSG
ncbi:MAG: hypothetical protein AB7I25_06775 [Vicinamibacterales bacterium]